MTTRSVDLPVPTLVKRNIVLFSLSQCFTGAGMQFAYFLGPLMMMALTGSASLAGLSVGLIALSRFFVAYPVGKITDTYGRKPGVLFGLALALVGSLVLGFSMSLKSPAMLIAGMLIFGMGMSAANQLRVAATDMFPPNMRARALGYLALGSLLGLVVAPIIVNTTDGLAKRLDFDPMALPWLILPVLIVGGMSILTIVRPDPMEIGNNLEKYYPGYVAPPRRASAAPEAPFSAMGLFRALPTRLAIVSNCACQANMSIVMVLTSLVLRHHGHSLGEISISHMLHSAGMFAFTIPLGRLADKIGRRAVLFPGVATTLVGAGLVTFTPTYELVTLGTFLVGLGWAGANVAATATIADHCDTNHRGRAIGVNDSFGAGVSVLAALVTGPLIDWFDLPAAGICAVVVAIPPLLMLAAAWAAGKTSDAPATAKAG